MKDDSSSKPTKTEREFLHDLATPLAIAIGQLETMIDEGNLTEAQQARLAKVQKAINRLRETFETRRADVRAASQSENK